jgi:DNA-directed RNA polymerase subunit RPC12/RpoP
MTWTTYHCGWCGWNGSQISAQRTGDGRYCCWECGMQVHPGPHSDGPGAGKTEAPLP